MSKAHNATGTIKQVAAMISAIADGALMEPINADHANTAYTMKHRANKARTHEELAIAAVFGSFYFKQYGDLNSAEAIMAVMEGK